MNSEKKSNGSQTCTDAIMIIEKEGHYFEDVQRSCYADSKSLTYLCHNNYSHFWTLFPASSQFRVTCPL